MIDTTALSNQLTGIVGLYAGFDADDNQPAEYHREPVVYLSDAHKLLRPEILAALGPNPADIYPVSYQDTVPYKLYDLVVQGGRYYESLTADSIGEDLSDVNKWRETTLLSAWYGRIERGAISKLARFLGDDPSSRPLLDRQPLYNKEGNIRNPLTKTGRFVGFRLSVKGAQTALYLAKVGLQLSGPIANIPIYLFRSDDANPVAITRLTGTTSGRSVWADINRYIYPSDNVYYLIGYFESDLPIGVQAIGAERSLVATGCSGCNPGDYELIKSRSAYVDLQAVYVDNPGFPGLMSWTEENNVSLQTWGLNLVIEARCNITQTLLTNRDMLTNALLHVVACDVLEEISTSDRVNSVAATMRNQAYTALNGQANAKSDIGLKGEKNRLISDLKTVMAKMAPNCLATTTETKKKISYGTVWDY